jgi:hypothetical protein
VNNGSNLARWLGGEGTGACGNPLATSHCPSGCVCTPWNDVVVQFSDTACAAQGLFETWTNGYYPTIVEALRGDWSQQQWACSQGVLRDLTIWIHGPNFQGISVYGNFPGGCSGTPPPPTPTPTPTHTPTPTPFPTPTPTPSPTGPGVPGTGGSGALELLAATALVGGAVSFSWVALRRDPALRARVGGATRRAGSWLRVDSGGGRRSGVGFGHG